MREVVRATGLGIEDAKAIGIRLEEGQTLNAHQGDLAPDLATALEQLEEEGRGLDAP
jgi:hypothetical protein